MKVRFYEMKQYDNINTKENIKPEKKQRSYDISAELGIKQKPAKEETVKQDVVKSSREYDIKSASKKKRIKFPVIIFIVVILLLAIAVGLIYTGYIDVNPALEQYVPNIAAEKENVSSEEDLEIHSYDDMFMSITSSELLELTADDTLIFQANSSNADKGIDIEFTIENITTGEYYCDNMVFGDGSFEWKPSDYIHEKNVEYKIGINQRAFKSNDLSTSIGSYYSTIIIKLTD